MQPEGYQPAVAIIDAVIGGSIVQGLDAGERVEGVDGSYRFSDGGAKAYTYAIQNRLEECVVQDNASYRALIKKKFNGDPKQRWMQKRKDAVVGLLLEGAHKAFSTFVRAYPAKEKAVQHIFNARGCRRPCRRRCHCC